MSIPDTSALIRAARQQLREIARAREALDVTPAGRGASMLVQTTTLGSYPTQAVATYVVNPVELDASDDEGAGATPTPDTDQSFFCVNLGSAVPPQGTLVVATACGGRWVMRYDG